MRFNRCNSIHMMVVDPYPQLLLVVGSPLLHQEVWNQPPLYWTLLLPCKCMPQLWQCWSKSPLLPCNYMHQMWQCSSKNPMQCMHWNYLIWQQGWWERGQVWIHGGIEIRNPQFVVLLKIVINQLPRYRSFRVVAVKRTWVDVQQISLGAVAKSGLSVIFCGILCFVLWLVFEALCKVLAPVTSVNICLIGNLVSACAVSSCNCQYCM